MKTTIFSTVVFLSLIFSTAYADDLKQIGNIRRDPLRGGNNFLIYDSDGNEKGRITPDLLRPSSQDHYLIKNKDGNTKGRITPDLIRQDSLIIEKKK